MSNLFFSYNSNWFKRATCRILLPSCFLSVGFVNRRELDKERVDDAKSEEGANELIMIGLFVFLYF